MRKEIKSINDNKTWSFTPLPPGHHEISIKWVYKVKIKANGTSQKKKSRLIVQGFEQKEGLDYEETFAPVVKWGTIRMLLALSAQHKWQL